MIVTGTSDLSPPPPAPPGNFRFAMGPTNNSTYNIMPSEELRQRSSNGGFDSSSVRREPLRASESFDPFDPRSNDDGSEGQFVNKTDTIVLWSWSIYLDVNQNKMRTKFVLTRLALTLAVKRREQDILGKWLKLGLARDNWSSGSKSLFAIPFF